MSWVAIGGPLHRSPSRVLDPPSWLGLGDLTSLSPQPLPCSPCLASQLVLVPVKQGWSKVWQVHQPSCHKHAPRAPGQGLQPGME